MRILLILSLIYQLIYCDLDIDDKCPELGRSLEGFENREVYGEWYVVKMIIHYFGRTPISEYETVVADFYLKVNGIEKKTEIVDVKSGNLMKFTIVEEISVYWHSNVTKRMLKYDISTENVGMWTTNGSNIQVMLVSNNVTVFTFCDSDRLFSLILMKKKPPYNRKDIIIVDEAQEIFHQYSLNVEAIKDFSSACVKRINFLVLLLFIAMIILLD